MLGNVMTSIDEPIVVELRLSLAEAVDVANSIDKLNGYASRSLEDLRTTLLGALVAWNSSGLDRRGLDAPVGAGESVEASRG